MQIDRAGVDAFAQDDVDAEILHRRIEKLLDRLGHAMDLVDEQDRSFFDVRQIGEQILGRGQGGPAGDLHADAHVVRDAGGEGRFAQARRAVQEDMAQRFAALRGGIDGDAQPLVDLALADHVAHPLRAQIAIFVVGNHSGLQDWFAGHGVLGVGAGRAYGDRLSPKDLMPSDPTYFCFCS